MEAATEAGAPPEQQYSEVGNAHYAGAQYGYPTDANEFTDIDQSLDVSSSITASRKSRDPNVGNYMTMPVQNGHADVLGADTNTSTSLHNATATPPAPLNPATKRKTPEDGSDAMNAGGDLKRRRSKVSRACDQCRKKKVNKPLYMLRCVQLTLTRFDAMQTLKGQDS